MTPPRSMSPMSDDRHVGGAGEAEVGDVAGAQVDLGGRARALDEDEIGFGAEPAEAVEHGRHELRLPVLELARLGRAHDAALHHDLRADVALGFQQDRVHVHGRRHAGGAGLQRLGPADLAAIGGHGGIVRHVLRLERAHAQAAAFEDAQQSGDEQRLADVGPGAGQHERARGHLNSSE